MKTSSQKCGDESGERCPARNERGRRTGARDESSVLFSLATLSAQADAKPQIPSSPAEEIVNLSGGGAFAASAVLVPPVVTSIEPAASPAGRRNLPVILASLASLGLIVVATSVAVILTRARPSTPTTSAAPLASAPPITPEPITSTTPSVSPDVPAPSASPAIAKPIVRPRTPTPAATPIEAPVAAPVATPSATTTTTTTTATTKCCPGESETACHMRLAVGASCGETRASSTTTTNAAPFDRAAAIRALALDVSSCKRPGGPTGPGHVKVTFQPSGAVSAVDVDAPYAGTAVGACVAQKYRTASVPPFSGSALGVGKSFSID